MTKALLQKARELVFEQIQVFSVSARDREKDERYKAFLREQIEALRLALTQSEVPDQYKVAVVGSFKVGKSSFVNALCDEPSLASVDSNRETAAITMFHYSDTAYAEVHMTTKAEWNEMAAPYQNPNYTDDSRYGAIYQLEKSGKLKQEFETSLAELERKYISAQGVKEVISCEDWNNKGLRKAFNKKLKDYISRRKLIHYFVDRLDVYVPVPFLRGGVILIDTPGLDDTDRYRVQLTEKLVEDVDIILYLTPSGASYSQSDKDFITTQLRKSKIKQLLVVVTKCDITFDSAVRDAGNNEENPPTFQEHLKVQEKLIQEQIQITLEELLRNSDVTVDQGLLMKAQLDNIPISFISYNYYQDKKEEAGVIDLRDRLIEMLDESERVDKAKRVLLETIQRVRERVDRNFKARLEAVGENFNSERVRGHVSRVSQSLDKTFGGFRHKTNEQTQLLRKKNETNHPLVRSRIQNMLLLAENVILDEFQMEDIAKHWATRRSGRWGYLYNLQGRIANRVFPQLEIVLSGYAKQFEETLSQIREQLRRLQEAVVEIERKNSIAGATIQPLNLTAVFDRNFTYDLAYLNDFVSQQRQEIINRLDDFISEEVRDKIYAAQVQVANIRGRGTTWRQNAKVIEFYNELKRAIETELERFVNEKTREFSSTLEQKAELIYPGLKNELDQVLADRLKAIEANLVQLNDYERQKYVEYLTEFLEKLNKLEQAEAKLT